jgi:hypothetical protein
METAMSSHLYLPNTTTDEQERFNLRRALPHPLSPPSALPRAWRTPVQGARGYVFDRGRLVEVPDALSDSSTPWAGDGTSWRLLPTALWIKARAQARQAHCHWSTVVAAANRHAPTIVAEFVPDWLVCGSCGPYFLGEIAAVRERDAQRARCWLAGRFLPREIAAVIDRCRACLLESIALAATSRNRTVTEKAAQARLRQVTKGAPATRVAPARGPTLH